MPSLYALVVGIDNYAPDSKAPQLFGCVNDATAVQTFLQQRFSGLTPNILSLHDADATRAGVIRGFREHLAQAGAGDFALFFYAGHGSELPSDRTGLEAKPDGKSQTKVLYDSRSPGGQDLLDMELGVLIAEVTARGPLAIVVLDCCHSGSSTRDMGVLATRQAPPAPLPATPVPPAPPELTITISPDLLAATPHIALEACDAIEVANEYADPDGNPRGAFTMFLLQELNTPQSPSYNDLIQRVTPRLHTLGQTPQLEAVNSSDDTLHNCFLSTTPAAEIPGRLARYTIERTWQMDAGSLLGFALGDTFTLYAPSQTTPATPASTATITAIQPALSTLTPAATLDTTLIYTAIATTRSAKIGVLFAGDPDAQQLLRTAAASAVFIEEAANPRLSVTAASGVFTIAAPFLMCAVPAPIPITPANAAQVIAALEHMANWIMRLELLPPSASALPANFIQLTVTEAAKPDQPTTSIPSSMRMDLNYINAAPPTLLVTMQNASTQPLYVALLAFSHSTWKISAGLLPAGQQLLGPGQSVSANQAHPFAVSVTPPATESYDDLLLIAATEPFDGRDFQLSALDVALGTRDIDAADSTAAPTSFKNAFLTRRLILHTQAAP